MLVDDAINAAKAGDVEALRKFIAEDPTLAQARSASGETALMAALYRGHMDCVQEILDAGGPLDVFSAAALGKEDQLDALLTSFPSSAASVAYDGWTPLHLAAFFGQPGAVERLLAAGAGLNVMSNNSLRNTPLHAAVAGGHVETSLLLIERGADVNARDAGGHTPFHIAAEGGYIPVVKALLERGADPHVVDAEDRTPLARAAARNHTEVVDLINLQGGQP
jgi:ankyrin repeat protein